MKMLSIFLGMAAFAIGLVAAWYWYLSACIKYPAIPAPNASPDQEDAAFTLEALHSLAKEALAIRIVLILAGRLNKAAAIWTAVSVLLSAAATGLGLLGSN